MTWRDLNFLAGALVRCVRTRVLDASAHGCLVDCAVELPEGTVGLLDVEADGTRRTDAVRVCRSMSRMGGALPYSAALEFLPLAAPAPESMRQMLARRNMQHWGLEARPTRRSSGPDENSARGEQQEGTVDAAPARETT